MANPAFNENTYDKFGMGGYGAGGYAQGQMVRPDESQAMTVEGTVNKTAILFALLLASSAFTFSTALAMPGLIFPLAIGGAIGALIVGLITAFRPQSSGITAPIYAVLEGLFLGAFSLIFNQMYPGIALQAIASTLGVFGIMLGLYRSGLVKVTEKLKMGVIAATGAIALMYLVSNLFTLFGNPVIGKFLWSSSPLSIGLSLLVIGVAAFNLLLDFDLIEEGVERKAPKFMEWYAGYGLMVTLVWLYLELLRLLAKLRGRD